MLRKPPDSQAAQFVKNGLPDGFNVRLANNDVKHFPTATRIEEVPNGGIEIWNDRIFLERIGKGQYLEYWQVFKTRPYKKRSR